MSDVMCHISPLMYGVMFHLSHVRKGNGNSQHHLLVRFHVRRLVSGVRCQVSGVRCQVVQCFQPFCIVLTICNCRYILNKIPEHVKKINILARFI